jgi:16S rRNA (uracil1498-N3)-methyltransferase
VTEPWLLIASSEIAEGELISLDPDEARHAAGALRLRVGARVVLANGRGLVAGATLRTVERRRVVAEIRSARIEPSPRGEGLTLAVGVLHGSAMDWAVQKAAEVGVRVFVPLLAGRSQPPAAAVSKRLGHWRRLARQAIKQCRRPWEMVVEEPRSASELIASRGAELGVVADREGLGVAEIPAAASRLLAVGPEGGFSADERRVFEDAGWPKVCLGEFVLRAETAAIVGSALLVARDAGP